MAPRILPMPLGEHNRNTMADRQYDQQHEAKMVTVVPRATAYDVPVKTPFSSDSSGSSSGGSSISGSYCSESPNGSSLSGSMTEHGFAASAKSAIAFTERTNTASSSNGTGSSVHSPQDQSTPQASPVKTRSRVPTLDAIAARMRKTDLLVSPRAMQQENDHFDSFSSFDRSASLQGLSSVASVASTPTQANSRLHRGRTNSALTSLVDRAAMRSRSTSPTKKSVDADRDPEKSKKQQAVSSANGTIPQTTSSSTLKDTPSLQDIVKRLGDKKADVFNASGSSPAMSLSGESSPATTATSPALPSYSCPPNQNQSPMILQAGPEQRVPPSKRVVSPTKANVKEGDNSTAHQWISPQKEAPIKPVEHPLEHSWAMYFDSKTWNPAPAQNADAQPAKSSAHSWEATLKMLGQYKSVESFMTVFRTLRRPSQLERNSNYHLFKDGIKPMWEDSANVHGGKWIVSLRNGNAALLDRSWMWLVLALIGEDLDEADDVCGAVVSTRAKGDRIALWIRDKSNVEQVNKIGRRFVALLDLEREPGVSLEFTANNYTDDVGDSSISSIKSFSSSRTQNGSAAAYYSFSNPLPSSAMSAGAHHAPSKMGTPFHANQQQQHNNFNSTQSDSPFQMQGTLGAHLRLHSSPGKGNANPNVNGRPPSTLSRGMNRRNSQDVFAFSSPSKPKSDTHGGCNSPASSFSMGIGAPIGRTNSPSRNGAVGISGQRPSFGLMNRTKLTIDDNVRS